MISQNLENKFQSLIDAIVSGDSDLRNIYIHQGSKVPLNTSARSLLYKAMKKAKRLMTLAQNECILIEGENSEEFMTNFFAVMYSCNIPVPVTTNLWINEKRFIEIIESIKSTTNAKIILGSKSVESCAKVLDLIHISEEKYKDLRPSEKNIYLPVPSDIAFIQFSSGSTGNPKGVTLTHRNVLANIRQISGQIISDKNDNTVISWLPVHHDMGLIGGLLVPLVNKFNIHIMTPYEFAVNPTRWLKLISTYNGNIIVAPNSGYHMTAKRVRSKAMSKIDLSGVRIALCGAEPINSSTLDLFADKFKECGFIKRAFVPCYGMAENTLAISFHRNTTEEFKTINVSKKEMQHNSRIILSTESEDIQKIVSCGKALDDIKVKIINSNGDERGENQVGEIIIKSPSMTKGYYNRPELNDELFINGYLRTGDIGFIKDGEIYITGRKKDLIIVGGININAEELETYATKTNEVRPGRLAAFAVADQEADSERIHIIIEARKDLKFLKQVNRDQLKKRISDDLCEYFPIKESDITIVAPGTISKTTSGKVQRSKMRELFLQGAINDNNYNQKYLIGRLKELQIKSKIFKVNLINSVKTRRQEA
ncbi:AMP-binding protein [Bacteriovorax sp. Seq25_V]|uniref:AMP-binding protein n=1 Tax=Bacteriovorax sp. Seq25_V TaxID=1201288 RepID=UPI00038A10D0|nr:AMP-binding protein [Bacteriovorax sp. Seq25_V]EQC47752.1 AMP-binding enzyme [Bacteriovorax sp. Seq25_V]